MTSDLRRPLPLLFLVLAVIGWIVAAWSLIDGQSTTATLQDQVTALRRQTDQAASDLKAQRAATGTLADTEARRVAVLGEITAAQNSLRAAETSRDEAQAQFKSTDDNLQQLTTQQSSLRQSVAQTSADLDKARADLDDTIRRDGAIKLQTAQAENDLSAAKAGLSKVDADRASAERAASDAATQRDTVARALTVNQTQLANLQRRIEGAQSDIAAAQAALPPLRAQQASLANDIAAATVARDQLGKETADMKAADAQAGRSLAATRSAIATAQAQQAALTIELTRLTTARDQLKSELDALRQTMAASTADVQARTKQADDLKASVAQSSKSLAEKTSELKRIEDAIAAARTAEPPKTP